MSAASDEKAAHTDINDMTMSTRVDRISLPVCFEPAERRFYVIIKSQTGITHSNKGNPVNERTRPTSPATSDRRKPIR
jgi:hypothetical protein